MKMFLSLGAMFLTVGTFVLFAQAERQWDPGLMGLAPALKEAGFDANDWESLIRAARHERMLVRQAAAYGLRFFSSPEGRRELLRLVDDPQAPIAIMACQTLAELKDTAWLASARGRLGSFADGHDQITMASVLAKMGDYAGWPLIQQNLTLQPYASAALYSAQFFIGMKDSQGKPVDIAQELELLAPQIESRVKGRVSAVVKSIREEQARRKAAGSVQ